MLQNSSCSNPQSGNPQFCIYTFSFLKNSIDYDDNENDMPRFARGDVVPYEGQLKSFRSFMMRANRYGMLTGGNGGGGGKMVLVDEIPSFAKRDPAEFRYIMKEVKIECRFSTMFTA